MRLVQDEEALDSFELVAKIKTAAQEMEGEEVSTVEAIEILIAMRQQNLIELAPDG